MTLEPCSPSRASHPVKIGPMLGRQGVYRTAFTLQVREQAWSPGQATEGSSAACAVSRAGTLVPSVPSLLFTLSKEVFSCLWTGAQVQTNMSVVWTTRRSGPWLETEYGSNPQHKSSEATCTQP